MAARKRVCESQEQTGILKFLKAKVRDEEEKISERIIQIVEMEFHCSWVPREINYKLIDYAHHE